MEKFFLPDGSYIDVPVGTSQEDKEKFLRDNFKPNTNNAVVKPVEPQPTVVQKSDVVPQQITENVTKENSVLYDTLVVAPYEGARKLINSTGNLIDALGEEAGKATGFYGIATGSKAKNGVFEFVSYDDAIKRGIKDPIWGEAGKIDFLNGGIKGFFYDPSNPDNDDHTTSLVGSLAETLIQFAIPYGGISKLSGATASTFLGKSALTATKGVGAGYIAFDENSGRFTDVIAEYYPQFADSYLSYLKSNPNDKWYEARFKNELEGLGLGFLAEFAFAGARLVKKGGGKVANYLEQQRDITVIEETAKKIRDIKTRLDEAPTIGDKMAIVNKELEDIPDIKVKKNPLSEAEQAKLQIDLLKEEIDLNFNKLKSGEVTRDEAFIIPRRYFNFDTIKTDAQSKEQFIKSTLDVFDALVDKFKKFKFDFSDDAVIEGAGKIIKEGNLNKIVTDFGEITNATKGKAPLIYAHQSLLNSLIHALPSLQRQSILKGNSAEVDNALAYIFTMWENKGIFSSNAGGNLRTLGIAQRDLGTFKNISENLERALNEFANFGGRDTDPVIRQKSFQKFKDRLSNLDDVSAVRRLLNYAFGNRAWDLANELWVNFLLSNPKTLAVNAIGNASASLVKPYSEKIGAWISKKGTEFFDPDNIGAIKQYQKQIDEASGTIASIFQYMGDALKYAKVAWKNGENTLEGVSQLGKADTNIRAIKSEYGGDIINIPTRVLNATDEFFKQINYRAKVRGLAVSEAKAQGLVGKEAEEYIANYYRNSFDETGVRGTNVEALQYAREATFTNDLEGFAKGFQNLVQQYPFAKQFFPFIRTPYNLAKNVVDGTPLAFAYRFNDLLGLSGNPRLIAKARGDLAMGSIMLSTAYLLYEMGILQGATNKSDSLFEDRKEFPLDKFKDKDLVRLKKEQGFIPYSFNIGGVQIPFGRIEPYGSYFGLIADIGNNYNKFEEKELLKVGANMLLWKAGLLKDNPMDIGVKGKLLAQAMVGGFRENILSKTYLTQVNDLMEAIMSSDQYDASQYVKSKIGSMLVPNIYTKIINDPYFREARNTVEEVKKRSGIGTPPSPFYNFMGEPLKDDKGTVKRFFDNVFNPIPVSTRKQDIIIDELIRIGKAPSKFEDTTEYGSQLRDFKAGKNSAWDRLNQILQNETKIDGKNLKQRLEEIIQSNYYKTLSERAVLGNNIEDLGGKYNEIKLEVDRYQDLAKAKFQGEKRFFKNEFGESLADIDARAKNNKELLANKRRTQEFLNRNVLPNEGGKFKDNLDQLKKFSTQ